MDEPHSERYTFGPFILDEIEETLFKNGERVDLTYKAFQILLFLIQNAGHVVTKNDLMQYAWPDVEVEEGNLSTQMSRIRKALGEQPSENKYIETVPRRGYRFVAEVSRLADLIPAATDGKPIAMQGVSEIQQPINKVADERASEFSGKRRLAVKWTLRSTVLAVCLVLIGIVSTLIYFVYLNRTKQTHTAAQVKSLAVLPFRSLNSNETDQYYGLGIADTLITKLSSISQLNVRPTSAVMKYTGLNQDPITAGQEQKVDAVLEGSFQKVGEQVRATARLLDVRDRSTLWTFKSDDPLMDIFKLQDSISEQVARVLLSTLTGEEEKQLVKPYTKNAEAYQLYMRGRFLWNRRKEVDLLKAIEHFQQAVNLDSNYALAYSGLSDSYILLPTYSNTPAREAYPKAKEAAINALRIDDTMAEAHTSLGQVREYYDWAWSGAESEYKRAISLNPNYPTAHHWYGYYLTRRGRFEEGISELKKAQELDPLSQMINADVAWGLLWLIQSGQVDNDRKQLLLDEATKQLRELIELYPEFVKAHEYLADIYVLKGMTKEAVEERKKAASLSRPEKSELFRSEDTWKGILLKQLDLELEEGKHGQVSAGYVAVLYARLGKKEEALEWLLRAYRAHSPEMGGLVGNPRWNQLRSDPRFIELMQRVGLMG